MVSLLRSWCICLFSMLPFDVFGSVLRVRVDGTDAGNCASSSPCATILYALSKVTSGDTIEIEPGTYTGVGNRNINLGINATDPSGLTIRSVSGPAVTIMDLESAGRGFRVGQFAGSLHIEGLTLTRGSCVALQESDDHNGAGLHLVNTRATVRNMRFLDMDCSFGGVVYTKYSGAAIYLKDSTATLDQLEVVDVVANHGGGVASWGNDRSKIMNSTFLRGSGTMWAGCMLMEENSSTEFHNVRFSYSKCSYGGAMDDGGTAHPLYKNCTFEYGEATYGGAVYHYGNSQTRYEDVIFQHNVALSAAVYINADTKPSFKNVLFYNNTAMAEAASVRSYYLGKKGPLIFENARFIKNRAATHVGGVQLQASTEFYDCVFDSNEADLTGAALAFMSGDGESSTKVIRSQFIRNSAPQGGAVYFLPAAAGSTRLSVSFENCSFVGNSATEGGAINVAWGLDVDIISSSFINNTAGTAGGALFMANILAPEELHVRVNDSNFDGNSASGRGGTIACEELVPVVSGLVMKRFSVDHSLTYGGGAGMYFGCSSLSLENGRFADNRAEEGNGGAILFTKKLDCDKGKGRIAEVNFHRNFALEGGGMLFFDHISPPCLVPMMADGASWNSSAASVWSWSDFDAAVRDNEAVYGPLQATAPVSVLAECSVNSGDERCAKAAGNALAFDGYPGIEMKFEAALIDDFGQRIVAPGLQVEVVLDADGMTAGEASGLFVRGVKRHALEDGVAQISNINLIGGRENLTAPLLVRMPRGFAALQHVKPARLHVKLGMCPSGFRNGLEQSAGVKQCFICSSGKFSLANASTCTVCEAGKYASNSGSSECLTCPRGHGCPPGASDPVPCNPGFYQSMNGSAECARCARGTYQTRLGSSECESCGETQTTQGIGSVAQEDCGCSAGFFARPQLSGEVRCEECPVGVACDGFGAVPLVAVGYYSKAMPADPAVGVWLCSSHLYCIGQTQAGAPMCSSRSEGLNCALCEPGSVRSADGTCEACTEGESAVLPLFIVGGFLACGAFHYAWNHKTDAVEVVESVLMSLTIGTTLAFMQSIGIMNNLNINWPQAFRDIMSFMTIFLFDLSVLNINCMIPESFEVSYISGLAMPACLSLNFVVWYFLSRAGHKIHQRCPAFAWASILNTIGMILQAVYISVVSVVVAFFICYQSGPNGERVLTEYPWQLCYTTEWMSMLPVAVLGLVVYVIGFMSILCWLSYVAPQKWSSAAFRTQTRFLMYKFRTDRWWFGVLLVFRSMAMAFVPVIAPDDGFVQFFLMLNILVGSILLQLYAVPYTDGYANNLEVIELTVATIILSVGSWFIEDRDYTGEDATQALVLTVVLCVCFGIIMAVLFGTFLFAVDKMKHPAREERKRRMLFEGVRTDLLTICDVFTSIDEPAQLELLSHASYVDVNHLTHIANFVSIVSSESMPKKKSKQRLHSSKSLVNKLEKSKRSSEQSERTSERSDGEKPMKSQSERSVKFDANIFDMQDMPDDSHSLVPTRSVWSMRKAPDEASC
eukprot:TRINITY_DN19275_c3_g1_i1.p1 TRINITY_DN19275_c3_g1~~TRINITY_DN19275_c3_g1_i1.p1  ORF type:complete len:1514 (+),score=206.78 TRINITY_DN19275_c3_g1_i1:83-4624(+)